MTISCVIPVYNSERYLARCVDSILNQTRVPDEVILVDDGSVDNSPAICDRYGKNSPVKVIHKENGGLISAWKAGVTAASGELLTFVDSDDYVDGDYIEELEKGVLEGCEKQISACGGITEDESSGRKTGDLTNALPAGVYQGEDIRELRKNLLGNEIRTVSLSRCMKLVSRKLVLENMRFADPKLTMGEDVSIMLPCLLDAERLSVTGHSGYHYVKRPGSMVQGRDERMYGQIRLLDRTIAGIAEEKGMPEGETQREKEYVWLLAIVVRNAFRGENGAREACRICLSEDTPGLLKKTGLKASSLKNRLLLYVMRKPTILRASIVGTVLR